MGEEEKKPEEKKQEEEKKPVVEENKKKKEEGEEQEEAKKPKPEEKKDNNNNKNEEEEEEKPAKEAQQAQEIVLKVYMHCEGCARKVRRSLKGFQGVEEVITDCKTSKVVVKGEKADPIKVLERVQRKSHRQVELISPIPTPPSEPQQDKKPQPEKDLPKPEEKKLEPQIVTVVLKVYMHCEACAQGIEKRIIRMKGVESAEADLKSSQVTVKGALDPNKLVEYVYKRTGKQAVIVKQDSDNNNNNNKEEKKDEKKNDNKKEEGEGNKKKEDSSEKQNDNDNGNKEDEVTEEENKVVEIKRNEFNYYYPQRYAMELYHPYNNYAPQIFSDENPNACSIM